MQDHLEALGLTAYEARALGCLLRQGPRTGPDLARRAGIPSGRVYDTLHALAERGLVSIEGGRPKRFAAAPAAALPSRLLAAEKRRMQDRERALQQEAASLESQLQRLVPRTEPAPAAAGVRLGADAARAFLIEATHSAQRRVDAFLEFQHLEDEDLALFDAFRSAVDRGVRTRILLREADVDYLLTTPYVEQVVEAMLPHLGETLQVRLTDRQSVPFSLLDDARVLLGVKDPLDPRLYFAVVHLDDPAFASDLRVSFDSLWAGARFDAGLLAGLLG